MPWTSPLNDNNPASDNPLAAFRLDDRLIVVTGASQGIGRRFAEDFARAGAEVVLVSRRPDKLDEVRKAITARGSMAHVVAADVSKLAELGWRATIGLEAGLARAYEDFMTRDGQHVARAA